MSSIPPHFTDKVSGIAPGAERPDARLADDNSRGVLSPEEEELARKQTELAGIENSVAEAEADLERLRSDLKTFEEEYRRVVAPCFAEMEQLRLDAESRKRADSDLESATCPSAQQASACPPSEFKTLFREVARTIHPDLATNEYERRRRDEAMAHANAAYAEGHHERLRDLLLRWKSDPDAVQGDDLAAELIRVIRRIARAKNRLMEIKQAIKEIRQSDSYFLRQRAERAASEGRDLLAEMRANLEQQIKQQRARVAGMQRAG
jgi:hypothetical protein